MPAVLVVGAGGREHAIVLALARSPRAPVLHAAPGNPGIGELAVLHPTAADDVDGLVTLAVGLGVDLVVVGPEVPLALGLVDRLGERGIAAFGPGAAAARLESSKAFCKEVLDAAGIRTASHAVVRDVTAGLAAIDGRYPTVIKADGLAAGKGVIIAGSEAEARTALVELLEEHRFDTHQVVVEEFLEGEECSLFALCDGVRAVPLASARDYKRIGDGDRGPNTGGMGAVSPLARIGPDAAADICAQVHQPLVDEMARRGTPFHGLLYAGLMLGSEGSVSVIEFNVRFGDPETQAILPRLRSDLLALLSACVEPGGLDGVALEWDPQPAVTVVMASDGYPTTSSTPVRIDGLERLPPEVIITHAGTARDEDDGLVTAGGRVLNLTALGRDLAAARAGAYAAVAAIRFDGARFRTDIALGL